MTLIDRVVSAHMRTAAGAPVPEKFPPTEMGVMTLGEFLDFRNPGEKYHPSSAYQTDLQHMNVHLSPMGKFNNEISLWKVLGDDSTNGLFIQSDGDIVVGVLHDGTLYHSPKWTPRGRVGYMSANRDRTWVELPVATIKRVKYITEYVGLVSAVAARNRKEYPHVVQNLLVKGEPFQLRSEAPPAKESGETMVILNSKGEIVAMASNEWGTTLLQVVSEYRSKGLGPILGRFWYDINPHLGSGGFTPAGERNAIKVWENRVREFLTLGWYTALIRDGRMTKARVEKILSGLSGARPSTEIPQDPPKVAPTKKDIRFMIEPDQYFVIYDARALEGDENEPPDEKYIHAHGFFRSSDQIGMFLYAIDYDRPFQTVATSLALQMARDMDEPLYIGQGYTDIVEWENIPGVVRDGDYITMTRDVLPVAAMAKVERIQRKLVDRYGQRKNGILEVANQKWA
jgi:hypothetical protein